MMLLRACCVLPLLLLAVCSSAQTTAALAGRVTDATSSLGLVNAAVEVSIGDTALITLSDSLGYFRFAAVPTGIAEVRARLVGYASVAQSDVWLRSGKPEQVELQLPREGKELPQATVRGVLAPAPPRPGTYDLTVEKSLRYPATFFDPARLANAYPGVAATNDQANHFSVRGNGPNSNAWLLEGAEIVSPNHLGNAGTPSDQPTFSGGGVNILSAQMLGISSLLTGAMPVQYGNALGGIMDMHMRNGASDRARFTVQAGLIGIDLSTEGPFAKGKRASYLVNYRYSTLGLLSAMGVDIGDEAISFQDLSFHVSLPMKRASLSVFGMGGISSNTFRSVEDTTAWEFDKDSQNIDYTGTMGAAGTSLRLALGNKVSWTTTVVISANEQERIADGIYYRRGIFSEKAFIREQKISATSQLRGAWSERFNYRIGGSAMERVVESDNSLRDSVAGWLLRPYAQGRYAITEHWSAEAGLGWSLYTFNGSSVPEPRVALNWRIHNNRSLSLAVGQRSQLPQAQNFLVGPFYTLWDNSHIGLTRLQEVVLAYDHAIRPHLSLHVELFYQHLLDVPVVDTNRVSTAAAEGFSLVNAWDGSTSNNLAPDGEARNQGIEVSLQHRFHRGFHYLVNATWLEANFNDALGRTYPTRWNTTAMCNVIIGKEFAKQNEDMKRTWGVNIRGNVMGGQRTWAIDTLHIPPPGYAAYTGEPFAEQLGTVYRIDLRVYLKREHRNRTGMWALDLLNATNAQNEAYRYYDTRQRAVVTKYQLGLIPNLSYRIEF